MYIRPGPRQHESSSSRDRPSDTRPPRGRGPESAGIPPETDAAERRAKARLRERDLDDLPRGAGEAQGSEADALYRDLDDLPRGTGEAQGSEADALYDLQVSEPPEGDPEPTADVADVPGPDPASEQPVKRGGQIEVSRVRGLQVGDGNSQENSYIWTVKMPPLDLAEPLESADVRSAVRALAADPTDRAARQQLLDKIAPEPLLGTRTTKLQVSQLGPGVISSDSPVFGTLFMRELSGVQVGDGNIQRNQFTYAVTPTADAAGLLRDNPKLAKALIDCAFPEKGSGDDATLNAALRDALEHAKVRDDGKTRSVRHQMPGPGEVLRLRNIDGVSVGSGSTQHREDEITAKGVTAVKPEHVGTSDPWASAASPE
jgi:hypothetical protein